MSGYLLDTQTIVYWNDDESGKFPAVKAVADARAAIYPLYVSAVTLGEIEYGHAIHPAGAGTKRNNFVAFLRQKLPQVLEVSKHTTEPYGRIRAKLVERFSPQQGWSKKGKKRAEKLYDPIAARELGIDENDLWIVAQAVERNLVLVTSDKLKRIRDAVCQEYPDFRVEIWTD